MTMRLAAKLRGDNESITAPPSPPTHPRDPTGSMDCAHAALLSFLANSHFQMDRYVVRGALGYAEDCAAFVSLGLGARFFPSIEYRSEARSRHKDSIPVKQRCFISHSKKEGPFVSWLKRELDRLPGTAVWFDDQDLSHGIELKPAIRSEQNDIFFLICSPSVANSAWVRFEAEHALTACKRIIPVIRAGSTTPAQNTHLQGLGLAERCGQFLAADFTDDGTLQEAMARLARSLTFDLTQKA